MLNEGKDFKIILDFKFDESGNLTSQLQSENAEKLTTHQIENSVLLVIHQLRTDRYEKRKINQKEDKELSFWSKLRNKINLN